VNRRVVHICKEVGEHRDDVLQDWKELIGRRPWLEPPQQFTVDHLPQLIDALVAAATCAADASAPRKAVVRFGLKHGDTRREADFPDHVLFKELHLLREAIWEGMKRRHGGDTAAYEAISRIDATITAATRASLHGFHRDEWDDEDVESLVMECPWPPELGREAGAPDGHTAADPDR
jgi:hypothetical protein